MQEEFLHFVWKYKLFTTQNFLSTEGEEINIIKNGLHNFDEGPDFLNASILYKNIEWNGSIEIHVESSDWEKHLHEKNEFYNTVILHIVYEEDRKIPFLESKNIPTLALKNYIKKDLVDKYEFLKNRQESIACAQMYKNWNGNFNFEMWYESLNIEKLEYNYNKIYTDYKNYQNNWEAVLFYRLAYVFGLKVNAEIFMQMAQSIPFMVVQKLQQKPNHLLALFLGKSGLLEHTNHQFQEELQSLYHFIIHKYNLPQTTYKSKFLRLRPANFPTIKLALLADLYQKKHSLFAWLIQEKVSFLDIKNEFKNIETHPFFDTHYTFEKESKRLKKKISDNLLSLIIINAIIPLRFAYLKTVGKESIEILDMLRTLQPEKNAVIERYKSLEFPISTAFDTQALLNLNKNYCLPKKCLHCNLGFQLLQNDR